MCREFESVGRRYCVDQFGVIHQTDARPFVYGPEYVATYATPAYRENARALSCLRAGWVLGAYQSVFGTSPATLVDVGYGDGAFIGAVASMVPCVYGHDISPVPPPPGCARVADLAAPCDVITFWDSLEHHHSLDFVQGLRCRLITLSVPWCHAPGGPWFDRWKHRKPDEHLHHFGFTPLRDWMAAVGWRMVASSRHEDAIRVPADDLPNILAAAFVRGKP